MELTLTYFGLFQLFCKVLKSFEDYLYWNFLNLFAMKMNQIEWTHWSKKKGEHFKYIIQIFVADTLQIN
jgi:hypothetical protein